MREKGGGFDRIYRIYRMTEPGGAEAIANTLASIEHQLTQIPSPIPFRIGSCQSC